MPFNQAQRQAFVPHRGQAFQFDFSANVFWIRFTIDPDKQPDPNQWYLLWSQGLCDYVDVYVPKPNGGWAVLKGGLLSPQREKAYTGLFPLYKIGTLATDKPQTYYLRLQSSESINGQLTLQTHQAYINQMPATLAMVWLVIGIQLLRVFYNVILARFIRDTSFRWYIFHTVIVTASVLGSFGVTGSLLGNYPGLAGFFNAAFYHLMPATYTLFIYSLLSVRANFPRLRWVFFFIVGASVLHLLLYPVVPGIQLKIANNYLFLFTEAFLISICLYSFVRRIPMNAYLLIPCFITLVPFIFLNLSALGYIHYGWIYPMIYITNFVEIVALALVLGKIIQSAEEKRLATEKAFFAEKLEAEKLAELDSLKSRFFTNISHEFRTPLTLLIAPISDLINRFPTDELYQIMHRNAARLQTLINQLLDLSKLDGGQLRPDYQTADLVADVKIWIASFESLAQSRQIKLSLSQSREQYTALYDADKLEKITTNLVSNALKFTPSGGQVRIDVVYGADQLRFTIADTGDGIASEHLPYIFDRFYQVDASQRRGYEGTGVGLALVRELVRLLGGQITAESQLEIGTTMTVTLPIKPVDQSTDATLSALDAETIGNLAKKAARPFTDQDVTDPVARQRILTSASTESTTDRRNCILVVEDNDDLRTYIRSILSVKYDVLEAIDGQQGLEMAQQVMPDLIVTDLMMPRLDGLEMCRALRADNRTNHIPVVMLTAKAAIENRLEGLEVGADDYLTKPFVPIELLVRIQNLLRRQTSLQAYWQRQLTQTTNEDQPVAENLDALTDQQRVFLNTLSEWLEQHLDQSDFDVEALAQAGTMSSRNLNRKLNALMGISASEFIRSYRLRRAAELLRSGLTPTETAYRVGFDNPSYFSRLFKERYVLTPSDYAKQNTLPAPGQ